MNQAGTQAYEGRSWQYEFGVGCVLRVRHFFSAHEEPYTDQPMTGARIDVVAYAGSGFGVKVYAKGTGADLFDSADQQKANAFAEHLHVLVDPCGAGK